MKDKKKRPRDISQLAASIVAETKGEMKAEEIPSDKNPHAVALGRLVGGLRRNMKANYISSLLLLREIQSFFLRCLE